MNFSRGHSGTKVQCESCLFSQEKTPEFTKKWAKVMNFSFWPFLWFGLPGRLLTNVHLGGRFGYFICISAREGKGESEAPRGGWGVGFLLKILGEGGGGVSQKRGRGLRGWEGVCGELGGGGLNIFFGGEIPSKSKISKQKLARLLSCFFLRVFLEGLLK